MEIVDQAVITGALNYILSNQEKSGRLPIVGRVHNFGLVVWSVCLPVCLSVYLSACLSICLSTSCPSYFNNLFWGVWIEANSYHFTSSQDDIAHSAFGLLALKSYVQTFEGDDSASSTVVRSHKH